MDFLYALTDIESNKEICPDCSSIMITGGYESNLKPTEFYCHCGYCRIEQDKLIGEFRY